MGEDQIELLLALAIARNNERAFNSAQAHILSTYMDQERFQYLQVMTLEELNEGTNETRRIMSRCLSTAVLFQDKKSAKKLLQYAVDT